MTNNAATEDGDEDSKNIIFCFVYKYRTRFPVVASDIIQSYLNDELLKLEAYMESGSGANDT